MSSTTGKPRVLVIGDAVASTGFARVTESIFRHLTDRWDIAQIGINYDGDPHDLPWPVYPARLGGPSPWGEHRLAQVMDRVQPQIVFLVNDHWVHGNHLQVLNRLETRPPVVLYTPVDSGPLDPDTLLPLSGVERFVTYTEFGRGVVEQAAAGARQLDPYFRFPEVEVIPHGVDFDVFRPLEADPVRSGESPRRLAKEMVFPDTPELHESWIVLNANRNQPRKRIDITMRGFADFVAGKPSEVKLYLHMATVDSGWDVLRLAKRYGIEDHLVLTNLADTIPAETPDKLNLIFNACEVGLNTAIAEAFGLVAFEHAATGAAQVVPNHSGAGELWDGAAEMLEPGMDVITERVLTTGWLIEPETVAAALERLYTDPQHLAEVGRRCHARATEPRFDWRHLAETWHALLMETLEP